MSDTWGAPGGISQAIGDQNVLSQTQARDAMLPGAIQLQQGQINKQPYEIMNLMANTGLHAAEAGLKNESLRQMKAMSEAMQGFAAGQAPEGTDPTDFMLGMTGNLVKKAVSVGAVDAAEKMMSNYQQIAGHKASTDRNKIMELHAQHQIRLDKINSAGSFLNGVSDQDSADEAAQQWLKTFGEPAPFASKNNPNWAVPYVPEMYQKMQEQSLTYKQKLDADLKDEVQKYKEQNRDLLLGSKNITNQLTQAKLDLAKTIEERRTQQGGKVSEPSPRQVQDAKDYIVDEDPRLDKLPTASAKLLNIHAKDVAYKAAQLRAANRGLEWSEALAQAADSMRDKLDILTTEPTKIPFTGIGIPGTGGDTTLKLKRGGGDTAGTRTNPIPVTQGFDPRAVKEGNYYINNGKLGVVKNGRVELVH